MTDRVPDEQIARLADLPDGFLSTALAREVQAWRRLIFGGPCAKCRGAGHLGPASGSPQRDYGRFCFECDGMGRTPGLAERLEVFRWLIPSSHPDWPTDPEAAFDAILADLRAVTT